MLEDNGLFTIFAINDKQLRASSTVNNEVWMTILGSTSDSYMNPVFIDLSMIEGRWIQNKTYTIFALLSIYHFVKTGSLLYIKSFALFHPENRIHFPDFKYIH